MQRERRLQCEGTSVLQHCVLIVARVGTKVFFVRGKYCAVAHMLVEDQATRRQSREVFCSTALAMLAAPTTLDVYHRQRIDPVNWGFAWTTLLSTIHHLRHLSCQRSRQVRCGREQQQRTWRGRGHSFFFQRRERAVHGNIRAFSSVRRRW